MTESLCFGQILFSTLASHAGKALPFRKIKLGSLQLFGVAAKLFVGRFALVNIEARSVPLDDVAVYIAKWHFAVKHPAVFSIRPSHARFVLKCFSAHKTGSPLGHNSLNVFRVNDSGPIPADHFVQRDTEIL